MKGKEMNLEVDNIRESAEFLNLLFNNITSAIFIVDKQVRVRRFNDAFKALFVGDEAMAEGSLCGNLIGCSYAVEENANCGETSHCGTCELRKSIIKAMTTRIPTFQSVLRRDFYLRGTKLEKYFRYTAKALSYSGEEMILVIVDDISELESRRIEVDRKNRELEKLNDLKNQFLGMAAHDLRNPIGVIQMFSDCLIPMMADRLTPREEEFLRTINSTSRYMENLINDVLDISCIESGKLNLNLEKVDFHDFVEQRTALISLLAARKSVSLAFEDLQPAPASVEMDKVKMSQVMDNIIGNAVKFSKPGSKVEIRLERAQKSGFGQSDETGEKINSAQEEEKIQKIICIRLTVSDNGTGISPDDLPRLFTPFGRGSNSATSQEKGTGLGLIISKRIIEGHGGEIRIASRLNEGTTVTIDLPVAAEADL